MKACFLLLALSFLSACSASKPAPAPTATAPPTTNDEKEYYDPDYKPFPEKSSWVLYQLNYQVLATAEVTGEIPTLEIDLTEGKARGNAGCNRYNGSVKLQGRNINFGHLVTTKVGCQAQPLENRYLEILNFGQLSFDYTPEKLTIKRDIRSVLEFKRVK